MALTTAQRWQFARLPIADSSITTGDTWAIAGLIERLSTKSTLTTAQRWQVVHLPIADSDIDTAGDRHALAHVIQSLETTGAVVELFEVTWKLDPTWSDFEDPQTNDGSVLAGLGGFVFGWLGKHKDPTSFDPPPGKFGRGGTSIRYLVEINGEFYEAFDDEHYKHLLEVKEVLEKKPKRGPQRVVLRMTPEISELLKKYTKRI